MARSTRRTRQLFIGSLPDRRHELYLLFVYLGLESTAALACTSKGWRESCDEMRSFCVQLIDVELRNFCGLAKFYPHLRYLDLKPSRHKKTLRVVDAKAMVKSCPLVESLDLGGYLLSDAALTTLVSHLKKLAQLGLRVWYGHKSKLTNEAAHAIGAHSSCLKWLDVCKWDTLRLEGLNAILSGCPLIKGLQLMPSDGISTREILDTIDANPKVRICSVINVRVCMYLEGTEDTLRNEWLDRCPTSGRSLMPAMYFKLDAFENRQVGKLSKLTALYLQKQGLAAEAVRFEFDGTPLDELQDYLEDGDTIDAFLLTPPVTTETSEGLV